MAGSRRKGVGGERPGGTNTQEGKGPELPRESAWAWIPLPGRRKPLESRPSRFGATEKRQERNGPERGAADREEQGPEGRTPRTLWRRRPSRGLGGSKPSGGYRNPEDGRCRGWTPRVIRIPHAECVEGEETPGEPIPRLTTRMGPRGRDSEDEPSARWGAGARKRARMRSGRPQGDETRRGSAEPNRRYRARKSLKRRQTSRESVGRRVTGGAPSAGP